EAPVTACNSFCPDNEQRDMVGQLTTRWAEVIADRSKEDSREDTAAACLFARFRMDDSALGDDIHSSAAGERRAHQTGTDAEASSHADADRSPASPSRAEG